MAQINWGEDIQNFFNNDLAKMVGNLFKFPTTCLSKFADACKVKSVVMPLMALVVGYIVTTLMFLIMGVDFGSAAKSGLLLVFFVVVLCILTFAALAAKGKSDINMALDHTAIHSFIFTISMVFLGLIVLIEGDGPYAILKLGTDFWGIVMLLVIVYGLSLGISCMRQLMSTVEGEGKESYAWWISPCVVVVALALGIYLATKIL